MDREDTPGRWPIKALQGRREGAPGVLMHGHHWFPYWKGGGRPVGCPGVFLRGSIAQTVQGARVGTVPMGGSAGEGRDGAGGDSPASQPCPTHRLAEHSTIFQWFMTMRLRSSALIRHLARHRPEGRWVAPGVASPFGVRGSIGFGRGPPGARPRRRVVAEPAAPTLPFRFPGFFDGVSDSAAPSGGLSARRRPMSAAPGPGPSLRFRLRPAPHVPLGYGPGKRREALRRLGFWATAGSWDFAVRRPANPAARWTGSAPASEGRNFGDFRFGRARRPVAGRGCVPFPRPADSPATSDRRKSSESFSTGRWPRSPVRRTSRRHRART